MALLIPFTLPALECDISAHSACLQDLAVADLCDCPNGPAGHAAVIKPLEPVVSRALLDHRLYERDQDIPVPHSVGRT
jgi:hypothetical protein